MTIFMQLITIYTNYSTTKLVGIGWKIGRFSWMGDNRGISDADMNLGSVFQLELCILVKNWIH